MASPLIELRGLWLAFGSQTILRGASLSVEAGEVVFAIGRSGSGKSVLSKIALGLIRPAAGEVTLLGSRLDQLVGRDRLAQARRGSALVVQGAALLSWLSLRDNVEVPLRHLGRREARARADETLAEVGLQKKAQLLPGAASAGERQLTAVARAIALRPQAVIFDEPTTGLPLESTLAVERQIRRAATGGAAVLVVSHDLDSLTRCADRFCLLDQGRLRPHSVGELRPGLDPELDLFFAAAASARQSARRR